MSAPWGRQSAIERYEVDPEFRTLVEQLYQFVCTGLFTLGELKQALTVAAIKFEMRQLPRLRLHWRDTTAILSDRWPENGPLISDFPNLPKEKKG